MNTKTFSLNGISTYGRLVDIYDGDTVKIIIKLFNEYFKFTCRLIKINAPEIKDNHDIAIISRNRIFSLLTKSEIDKNSTQKDIQKFLDENTTIIFLKCFEFDKYGRVLVDVFTSDNKSISDILLDEKLVNKYIT